MRGFGMTRPALSIVRHGGTSGRYRAEFRAVPSASMTLAIMCNDRAAESYALTNRVMDVYLGDRLAAPTPSVAAASSSGLGETAAPSFTHHIGDLASTVFCEEFDVRWMVLPRSASGIALQRRNLSPIPLASCDTTNMRFTLTATPVEVRFKRDGVGRVTGFVVDARDITNIRFAKLK